MKDFLEIFSEADQTKCWTRISDYREMISVLNSELPPSPRPRVWRELRELDRELRALTMDEGENLSESFRRSSSASSDSQTDSESSKSGCVLQ